MGVEIRLEKSLTDEERIALFGWGENIFGVEDAMLRWRPKEWHFIVETEGRAVAHVGVVQTSVRVGEREISVGGVGSVVSVPEARGRGHVHEAMRRAYKFMCEELKVEAGMLFCLERLVAFYARQGWQLVEDTVEIEQPDGTIAAPLRVMVKPCGAGVWPAGKIEVGGLPW